MKKIFLLIAFTAVIGTAIHAQLTVPAPSPNASFTQKVGLTEIKVDYSRPNVRGRKIFGETIPFGEIWRTGANEPTKFTTTDSITVAGMSLQKGTYIILSIPGANEWQIIFNKNLAVSYTNYLPNDDVLRLKVKPQNTNQFVESFTMSVNNVTMNTCNLDIAWANTLISLPITNDIDTKIMAQIKQKLDGPTANEYNAMARYYYDTNKDANKALDFVNKGIAKGGENFGNLWLKSLITARLGDKTNAIIIAKQSMEKAISAKNMDYVRMNQKNISDWSK